MPSGGWLTNIRGVVFDAVGTLIVPHPPASIVYSEVGRRHGSRLDLATIRKRFDAALRREEEIDLTAGWCTSAEREEQRWRSIVAVVLADVSDVETCFNDLWNHFARSSAWHIQQDAGVVLSGLASQGLTLGIASNFDGRLRSVVAGFPELAIVPHLVISAEVGWRKPAPAFFENVAHSMGCDPDRLLFVGDDHESDYLGATAAGLNALLLGDQVRKPAPAAHIARLADLLAAE